MTRELFLLAALALTACGGSQATTSPTAPPPDTPPPATDADGGSSDAARPCVQNVMCVKGAHFDRTVCRCVSE